MELLAEVIHNMWMKWAKEILKSESNISTKRRKRWESCFVSYKDLSEHMKNKDRKIAKQIIKTLKESK